ncbi:MAG: leucine-rich repeat domain-containing protein, partial [Christensenellaceae bacterium]|nr:leucine-rich repeat domain-containing protein [Christensenellaceae bacterium]
MSSGTEVQQIEVNLANVRTIGNYAFQNSTITNVAFDSLSKLGIGAFKGSNVAAADFSVAPLDYVAAHSFEGCGNLASVNLGGIKTVARDAFKDSALSSVTNADGLQKVDAYAFNGSALPSVTVFGNVEDIEEYAFHNTPYF